MNYSHKSEIIKNLTQWVQSATYHTYSDNTKFRGTLSYTVVKSVDSVYSGIHYLLVSVNYYVNLKQIVCVFCSSTKGSWLDPTFLSVGWHT